MDEKNENSYSSDTNSNYQPVSTAPAPAPVEPSGGREALPPEQKPKSGRGRKLAKVFSILFLLAAISGGAWYLWQRSQPVEIQPQQSVADIDVLRFGSVQGPANHIFPNGETTGLSFSQSRQIYEGLVGSEDKKFVPLLAESWTNPDQSTWLFKLKHDVKFHTGKTMTAQDVKSSFEALKDMEYWSLFVETMKTIEVINDNEIKIVTTEPDALLLNRLSLAFVFDTAAADKTGANGTGAYTLNESKEYTESFAAMKAFEQYHQGAPKTKNLEYIVYNSEAEVVKAQLDGKINYSEVIVNPENQKLIDAKYSSQSYESPGVFGMYLNIDRANSPLKDPAVRKAIAQAVNRADLIKKLDNDTVPADQVIPKSLPGFDASLRFPAYDLEAAKKALAKAQPNGVTLEYIYFKDVQPDAPILIEQLKAAGINVVERAETNPEILTQKLVAGEFDLFSGAYTSDLLDSRDLLGATLGKESSYPTYQKDSKYDELLVSSDSEFDPTKRIAILQEVNKYITDNLLWVPLRNTSYIAFYENDLHVPVDYEGGSNLGVYYWRVGRKVQ